MCQHESVAVAETSAIRRAHALSMEFADENIRLRNFLTRRTALLTPAAVTYLSTLSSPKPYAEAIQQLPAQKERARVLMNRLIDATILHRMGSQDEMADQRWAESWNFGRDAAALHFSIRPCNELMSDERHESRFKSSATCAAPAVQVEPESEHKHVAALPQATIAGIAVIMNRRRSARHFTSEAVTQTDLSQLLFSMTGVTGQVSGPVFGEHALSFSPSAGALNPYDIYVIPGRVTGVPAGTYRYDQVKQSLDCIGPSPHDLAALADGQPWASDAAFITLLVASMDRAWSKYATGAAYVNVLIEAGHRAQNGLLMGTELGLSARMTTAIDDNIAQNALRLTSHNQAAIYLLAFGYEQ